LEENISCVSIDPSGKLLLVCTRSFSRIYKVEYGENLVLTRIPNINPPGAVYCAISDTFLVLCEYQSMRVFSISMADDIIQLSDLEIPTVRDIAQIKLHGTFLAIACTTRTVSIFQLSPMHVTPVIGPDHTTPRVPHPVAAMTFVMDDTVLAVTTVRHNLLLFDVRTLQLTDWSRRNANRTPVKLSHLQDAPLGVFTLTNDKHRIWQWGANWVSWIKTDVDLPELKEAKFDIDEDNDDEAFEGFFQEYSPDHLTKAERASQTGEGTVWWVTYSWRSLLGVVVLPLKGKRSEMAIIERPVAEMLRDMNATPWYAHQYGRG
jgi:hypothetical protein